jgi:lipopolysaccharide export system protein LptC
MNTPEPRTILSLLLLLAGAIVSAFIVSGTWKEATKPARAELSLAYYLDQAELTGTGPDGKMLFQVQTRRAAQSLGTASIEMDGVRMIYGPPTALPWEINANTGRISTDASIIELSGDVVAISATEGNSPTIIRTQQMDIDPATRQASTTRKVTLEFDGRIVNATGMRANFETNELQLLSNVNGKFLP